MNIGQLLLVRHNGQVHEGKVEIIYFEDLDIRLKNGELIRRKFWEVHKIELK